MSKVVKIGILDIQGSVEEHFAMIEKIGGQLGAQAVLVKTKADLDRVDGLIIPGGESTVIGKLMKEYGLDQEIRERARFTFEQSMKPLPFNISHLPLSVWGTCAGAILLAKKVSNRPPEGGLGLMNIEIARNAYGRQLDSFESDIEIPALKILDAKNTRFHAVFIRAPQIKAITKTASNKAKILAKYGAEPIMVEEGNLLATTFHPELTNDPRIHEYFVRIVRKYAKKS